MADAPLHGGFLPAIITPLKADRSVDVVALRSLIKHMFGSGVSGLYIGGASTFDQDSDISQ